MRNGTFEVLRSCAIDLASRKWERRRVWKRRLVQLPSLVLISDADVIAMS
jgi:hypothetical protein